MSRWNTAFIIDHVEWGYVDGWGHLGGHFGWLMVINWRACVGWRKNADLGGSMMGYELGERAWEGTMGSERNGYEGFGGRAVIWSRFDSGDKRIGGFGVHGTTPMLMKWHWWCHMMVRRETIITREATIVAVGMTLNWHWVPTVSKGFIPCSCMLSANSSHSLWLLVVSSHISLLGVLCTIRK